MSFLARAPSRFPLSIHSSNRYFIDGQGNPFFLVLDAGWQATGQLTREQILTYLQDRAARGFNATILEMPGEGTSSQNPTYLNAYGDAPFTTISADGNQLATGVDFSTAKTSYWQIVDYYIDASAALGMVVVAFPAYVAFPDVVIEGWYHPVMNDTAAHLQSFGAFLANRYGSKGNIIWGMAGDNTLSQADLDQNWNIVTGMRSVRSDFMIYVKAQRNVSSTANAIANGGLNRYPGLNVNNAYVRNNASLGYSAVSQTLQEYQRTPAMVMFCDETTYELDAPSDQDVRIGLWCPPLCGSCGACFGNGELWAFGGGNNSPHPENGPADALTATYMDTNGAHATTALANLFAQYHWEKLVPTVDTSFVTTSLGTDNGSAIAPALASDGSFGMIYTCAGTGFTVNLAAITHGSVRARWFDPTNGNLTTASGSPFANSGTHAFTTPGNNAGGGTDWTLVLD